MREYSLQDPEYRKTIDLTNYRTLIENTIHSVSPTINVEVYKDHYTIDPDPPKGDLIKIGRLLAQMNNLICNDLLSSPNCKKSPQTCI